MLEDKLLKELSSSEGNILDNEELIATLDKTKGEAEDIKVCHQLPPAVSARTAFGPSNDRIMSEHISSSAL